jgi:hypothetical protein
MGFGTDAIGIDVVAIGIAPRKCKPHEKPRCLLVSRPQAFKCDWTSRGCSRQWLPQQRPPAVQSNAQFVATESENAS